MIRRLILAVFALGLFVSVAAPKPSSACPLICVYKNGHWVCGCQ